MNRILFFVILSLAGSARAAQVTTPIEATPPTLATADTAVDPAAKAGAGRGDAAKDYAVMMDDKSCTHTGQYYYQVDPYGQLSLAQRMDCKLTPSDTSTIPSVSTAFICQLDGSLKCDNHASSRTMNKVLYGQNVYTVTASGVTVNKTQYGWLDAAGTAGWLPAVKDRAAQQITAYQKIFNKQK